MDESIRHRALLQRYWAIEKVFNEVFNTISILAFRIQKTEDAAKYQSATDRYIETLPKRFADLDLDFNDFGEGIKQLARYELAGGKRACASRTQTRFPKQVSKEPTGVAKLRSKFKRVLEDVDSEMGALPPSIAKTLVYLAADAEREPEVDTCVAAALLACDVGIPARATKQIKDYFHGVSSVPDYTYAIDESATVSLMRCYEYVLPDQLRVRVPEFRKHLTDEVASGVFYLSKAEHGHAPHDLRAILLKFWSISRSRTLRYGGALLADQWLDCVRSWQQATGAWVEPKSIKSLKPVLQPDPQNTALALHFLITFGDAAGDKRAIGKAADWLLKNTAASHWTSIYWSGSGDFDVFTTIIALDALRRANVDPAHPRIVGAEKLVMSRQHQRGVWFQHSIHPMELTGMMVDYFRLRQQRGPWDDRYIRSARALLGRAEECVTFTRGTDAALGVVAAYHGLEHLLYALITASDHGEQIYKGAKTIGFRDALAAFERVALTEGWLQQGQKLPFRSQLDELAARRDDFIHRGAPIEADEASRAMASVRSFVRRFDTRVLGFSVLD